MFNKQYIYDKYYISAVEKGLECWGGNKRSIKKLAQIEAILNSGFIPVTGNLLEAGCGEGILCREFYKRGFIVTGADISKAAIEWAISKSEPHKMDIKYIHSDLTLPGLNFNDTYDVIIDGNCLHCITGPDRQGFLKNLYNMLSPSGVLYISSLSSPDSKNHTTMVDDIPYRFIPSEDYLLSELEASGFRILDLTANERVEFNHINVYLKK